MKTIYWDDIIQPTKISDNYITQLRLRCRCTQQDLARYSGVKQANIAAMETGKRVMSDAMRKRLTDAAEARLQDYFQELDDLANEVFQRPHLVQMRGEL